MPLAGAGAGGGATLRALRGAGAAPPPFLVKLWKIDGARPQQISAEQARAAAEDLQALPLLVSNIERKERRKNPPPPFITSKLQQEAARKLRFTAKRTMGVAQRLYEGVELGDRGLTALITYMRTDSTRIADEARDAAKAFIEGSFGKEYLPKRARVYKAKGGAQDAHEAIRPVDVNITPDEVKSHLPPEQYNLYRLIWARFVASQMAGARFHDTTATISCAHTQWKSKGERLLFAGLALGWPDEGAAINQWRSERDPFEAWGEMRGFSNDN